MRYIIIMILFIFSFHSLVAQSIANKKNPIQVDTSKPGVMWLCKLKNNVRTIRVEKDEEYCRTVYTKEGSDAKVAEAKYLSTCLGVLENIKTNLSGADWVCRDISDSRISSSKTNFRENQEPKEVGGKVE